MPSWMEVELKSISAGSVLSGMIRDVGFDPDVVSIKDMAVLSAIVRRTAGLLCPCTKRTILKNIMQGFDGVVPGLDDLRDDIDETIDLLIAHGDLLEHNDITPDSPRSEVVVSRAPLAFIKRLSGACVILGVALDDRPVLPDSLQQNIQYNNFNRVIMSDATTNLSDYLLGLGFIELPYKAWSSLPPITGKDKHVEALLGQLSSSRAHTTDNIEGLKLLDPTTPIDFYPDRWVKPRDQTGHFVARRPQAYGADLWCYVELYQGKPKRFLDLPLMGSRWRGCDEAWHLQAAIDAVRGNPQLYRIREGTKDYRILDLFSPIPSWAQRRWVMVGTSVLKQRCLLSYRFRSAEIGEEVSFAKEHLWMAEKTEQQ